MRPLYWDSNDPATGLPYTYDSKNLTWDGILEPGDPGYEAPDETIPTQLTTKSKKMKHRPYYPTNVPEQILWLINFFNKLIGHAATLGVSSAACAAAVADARWIIYLLSSWQPAKRAWAKSCTESLKEAQLEETGLLMVLPTFVPPAPPAADPSAGLPAVVPVKTGALNRIFSLVQVMQEAPGYSDSLALDLRLIGTALSDLDFDTLQPSITAEIRNHQVFIGWGWGGNSAFLDMLQIQVDRADGKGFVDLAYDTTPNYIDTADHPATLTKWKYRAIYRVEESQVGLWSAEVSVVVGG
jgi:hypothetical protein